MGVLLRVKFTKQRHRSALVLFHQHHKFAGADNAADAADGTASKELAFAVEVLLRGMATNKNFNTYNWLAWRGLFLVTCSPRNKWPNWSSRETSNKHFSVLANRVLPDRGGR